MKFVIVIALGNKCPFLIIWEQYNSPRWELPVGTVQVTIVLGGIVWRQLSRGGQLSGWQLSLEIVLGGIVLELGWYFSGTTENLMTSNHLLFRGQISNATGTNHSRR